jgi:transcriptional regulator with XRE-family HTH domain
MVNMTTSQLTFSQVSSQSCQMNQQQRLKSLGETIRAARKAAEMTQQDLATVCGFDTTYISMLENGKRNPPFLTLCSIARGLNSPLHSLLRNYRAN